MRTVVMRPSRRRPVLSNGSPRMGWQLTPAALSGHGQEPWQPCRGRGGSEAGHGSGAYRAPGGAALAQTISRRTDSLALVPLVQGQPAVADSLTAGEAADVAAALTRAMDRPNKASAMRELAQRLTVAAGRLGPR